MSSAISCRLCSFSCGTFKKLFDDNGEINGVYKVAVKYFDSSLLDGKTESTQRVICLECWQHINDFHSFQQWILNAQIQEDLKFSIYEEKKSEQIPSDITNLLKIDNTSATSIISNDSALTCVNLSENKKDYACYSKIVEGLECKYCKKAFRNYLALGKHLQICCPITCPSKKLNAMDFIESNIHKKTSKKSPNRTVENSFKCETCGASFSQYGSLRRHIRKKHTVHPLLRWICKYCNKMFKNRSCLERHKNNLHHCQKSDYLNSELQQRVYKEESQITDSEIGDIKMYDQKQTITKKVNSDVASVSFEINHNMQIQMPDLDIVDIKSELSTDEESDDYMNKVQNGIGSEFNLDMECDINGFLETRKGDLECPRCNHQIRTYLQLNEHFILKHPEERCYINCCNIILYDQESIVEHMQFHKNPNAFKCTDCGKCFKNKKGLSSHKLQVHRDNRSTYHLHLCYCKKAKERRAKNRFDSDQSKYDAHECCQRKKKILEDDALIAKWKNELACEICEVTFSYYSLMRAHFYHEHPGEKCHIFCCQRKMSRISDALEHIRHHLDPHVYRCKICNVDFSAKNTLAKHMRNSHSDSLPKKRWVCDQCDKTFEMRQVLTRHKNVHHSKKSD